jgi:hypothetical protein
LDFWFKSIGGGIVERRAKMGVRERAQQRPFGREGFVFFFFKSVYASPGLEAN